MNVVLIAIDTLRADHLSCYGYWRRTSPNLDKLARDSMLFRNCFTVTSHTMPSYTSMLTGLSPVTHGIVGTLWCLPNEPTHVLDDTTPTLAESLQARGYLTCAVDNLLDMACHPGWFARGFEHYINFVKLTGGREEGELGGKSLLQREIVCAVLAEDLNARAIPWIKAHRKERSFLFLHYWDTHQPYNAPEPFTSRWMGRPVPRRARTRTAAGEDYIRGWGRVSDIGEAERRKIDLYDAEVSYVDHEIGRVIRELKRLGLYDDSLIIVTSDHGETMAEHHEYFHHREVYDPIIHVPLIVKLPASLSGTFPVSRESDALVQNLDLYPTILDMVDGTSPPIPLSVHPFDKLRASGEGATANQEGLVEERGVRFRDSLDGMSLVPTLTDAAAMHRSRTYTTGCFIKDGDSWKAAEACVRTGRWKLVRRADISRIVAQPVPEPFGHIGLLGAAFRHPEVFDRLPKQELFDLAADPEELRDVSGDNTGQVEELCRELAQVTGAGVFCK